MTQLLLKENFLLNRDQKLSGTNHQQVFKLRNQIDDYVKHVGNYKHAELKVKKFEEVQALYEKIKRSDEDFISIGSAEDESKEEDQEESKEEVQEESKEEESTRKRKLGTRKKMKSRKRRYIQNTSKDDSDKENDELRLHLTIAPDEEKEVDYEIIEGNIPMKEYEDGISNVMFDPDDEMDFGMGTAGLNIMSGCCMVLQGTDSKCKLKLEYEEDNTMALSCFRLSKKSTCRVEPEE
ncbi:hypothetical protein Tco_0454258 [Tanacetum coccineum]